MLLRSLLIFTFLIFYTALIATPTPQKEWNFSKTGEVSLKIQYDRSNYSSRRYFIQLEGDPILQLIEAKDKQVDNRPIFSISQIKRNLQIRLNLKQIRSEFKKNLLRLKFSHTPKIIYEYDLTWHGVSIELADGSDLSILKQMKSLPNVKSIFPVRLLSIPEVKEMDPITSSLVSDMKDFLPPLTIEKIWMDYHLTGEKIKIAVIDTGVDYTHPDLGGCLGETCKVIGGYDFIHNRPNPMDDHGHGTHVAGISAGSGLKKGVAPNALIVAYKVLDKKGYGPSDGIIKAIEMAIDPHGDGSFRDCADIINLSLGGEGSEYDPLSMAINSVAKISYPICAAGNKYTSQPIGSPAAAPQCLTVGATDESRRLAYFSSVGPSETFTLKPDISAPGYEILSTFPGNQYAYMSGTSMSTPYMSGLLALYLQKFGHQDINLIKSQLATTANSVQLPPAGQKSLLNPYFYAGYGEVEPYSIFGSDFFLYYDRFAETSTSTFYKDLRMHEYSTEGFEYLVNLPFRCSGSLSRAFSVSLKHDLGEKMNVHSLDEQFQICGESGTSKNLQISLKGLTKEIPSNLLYPYSKGVLVTITDIVSKKSLVIPISVFIKSQFEISINGIELSYPPSLTLFSKNGPQSVSFEFDWIDYPHNWKAYGYVNPGVYDLFFQGFLKRGNGAYYVYTRSEIAPEKEPQFTLTPKDFSISKRFQFFDPLSNQFMAKNYLVFLMGKPGTIKMMQALGLEANTVMRYNPFTQNWRPLVAARWVNENNSYFVGTMLANQNLEEVVYLPENGYSKTGFDHKLFHSVDQKRVLCDGYAVAFENLMISYTGKSDIRNIFMAKGDWLKYAKRDLIFTPDRLGSDDDCFSRDASSVTLGFYTDGNPALFKSETYQPAVPLPNFLEFGKNPTFFSGKMIADDGYGIYGQLNRVGRLYGEKLKGDVPYQLIDRSNNSLILEATVNSDQNYKYLELPSGDYELIRYYPSNENAAVKSRLDFSINREAVEKSNSDLPTLEYMSIDKKTDKLDIYFSHQLSSVRDVVLSVGSDSRSQWTDIPLTAVIPYGGVWRATLDNSILIDEMDLKIEINDFYNNSEVSTFLRPFIQNRFL